MPCASLTARDTDAQPAREVIRGLIERVSVRWEDGQAVVVLDGALSALMGLAQNAKSPALAGPFGGSVKLVAGAGCIEAPTLQVAA